MSEIRQRARTYLAEGVVIVAGILIALAADALWEYRGDRADERTVLRQLQAEFDANAAQLDTVAANHRLGRVAALVMIGAVRGGYDLAPDSVHALVRILDQQWTFNPKLAALESVVASGQLGLIRDDSLRVELVGWPGVVEDMTEDEIFAAEFTYTAQYEALSRVLNFGDVYAPMEGAEARPIAIAGDEALESVLAYRLSWYESVLDELGPVEAATSRVRDLLAANLEDR